MKEAQQAIDSEEFGDWLTFFQVFQVTIAGVPMKFGERKRRQTNRDIADFFRNWSRGNDPSPAAAIDPPRRIARRRRRSDDE